MTGSRDQILVDMTAGVMSEATRTVVRLENDGIDGSETSAGAIVTPDSLARAYALELEPRELLAANDAWVFFDRLGDLVTTGPTLTNVNDFRAVLINAEAGR